MDKEKFIKQSKDIHGDKYDYSLIKDINSKVKVKIICKEHGIFEQTIYNHLNGHGCGKCANKVRYTLDEFIKKCKNIHGDKYDYSLVEYRNAHTKIKIICKKHGIFEQKPKDHINNNHGCPLCVKITKFDFIKKSNNIHNNKYDYSLVEYINNKTKVKIICKEHGIFEQTPSSHLNKNGCHKCGIINRRKNIEDFIKKSNEIHGNKYDYSLVKFNGCKDKIKIICPIHGEFQQILYEHYNGQGCPSCNESKGEKKIRIVLEKNNIKFERQKKFKDCKYKKPLPFDFYLLDYNTCIEFDGEQHFKSNKHFGGDIKLIETQKRDNLKNEFCKNNNIKLIRIKYDDKVDNILNLINI